MDIYIYSGFVFLFILIAIIAAILLCYYDIKMYFASAIVPILLIVWIICAYFQPIEIDYTEKIVIQTISYPDGKKKQISMIDGQEVNINSKYGYILPENSYIFRIVNKRIYLGVYFHKDKRFDEQFELRLTP